MRNETVLWGVKKGDEDWQEVILSTNPLVFEKIKVLAAKDGFGRFRVAIIDLSRPPAMCRTSIIRSHNAGRIE